MDKCTFTVRARAWAGRTAGRTGILVALVWLIIVFLWALAPGWFTDIDPISAVPADKLRPPSREHLFGTDQIGRDLFARVIHGAGRSIFAAVVAIVIGLTAGALVGLLAGFFGGWVDELLMRVTDVVLAIPGLLLSLTIVSAVGFGTVNVAIAVGVGSIAGFARLMRASVVRIRRLSFVEAAYASGSRGLFVATRHVLPNSWGPVIALSALEFGTAVLAVSALSFLGFGAEPPAPEWGALISNGRNYLATAWWLITLPGVVVVFVVLASSRLSRVLGRS